MKMRLPSILAIVLMSTLPIVQTGQTQQAEKHFGVIDDSYDVNASGAYNHLVPIQVPPGINGLVPSLALVYDSRSGVSDLGIGWALTGISKLSRGGNNFAQHGRVSGIEFSTKDSFFLDGQYLSCYRGCDYDREQLNADYALYRTESETFALIKSEGSIVNSVASPKSFVVKRSSGITEYYGITENSRREVALSENRREVLDWYISRVEDTFGNFIEFDYKRKPDNSIRISSIKYTGNRLARVVPQSQILFEYCDEAILPPSTNLTYIAGIRVENNNRLRRIAVHTEGHDFKYYNFKYDASMVRLLEIKESRDAQALISLPTTDIRWQSYDSVSYSNSVFLAAPQVVAADSPVFWPFIDAHWDERHVDVDNDGVEEVIIFQGRAMPPNSWYGTYLVFKHDGKQYQRIDEGSFDRQFELSPEGMASKINQSLKNILTADINGDSLPDFVTDNYSLINTSSSKIGFRLEKNTVSNKSEIVSLARDSSKRLALDLDGDSKDEIFVVGKDFKGHQIFDSEESKFTPRVERFDLKYRKYLIGDLNGDSIEDIAFFTDSKLHFTTANKAQLLAEREYPRQGFSQDDLDYILLADVNNDGLADLILQKPKTNLKVWLNDGNRFIDQPRELGVSFELDKSLLRFGNFTNSGYQQILFAKVVDGNHPRVEEIRLWDLITMRDEIRLVPSKIQLRLPEKLGGRIYGLMQNQLVIFRDLNFDGVLEIVETIPDANPNMPEKGIEIYSSYLPVSDKVIEVTDGFENKVRIEYTGLKNLDVYQVTARPLNANYKRFWGTYPLVKSIKYSNGRSDDFIRGDEMNTVRYTYTDLIVETTGRGLSGFRRVSRIEERTKTRTDTDYQYEFPLSGKILAQRRISSTGVVSFQQVNEWDVKIYAGLGQELGTTISEADVKRAINEIKSPSRQESVADGEKQLRQTLARLPHLNLKLLEQDNPSFRNRLKIDNPTSILKAVGRFNRAKLTYLPVLVSSTVEKREVDKQVVSVSSVSFTYDNFGNVPKTETHFGDGSRLVVEKEFFNMNRVMSDATTYIIGLVAAEKTYGVSSKGIPTASRTIHSDFDAKTGALAKRIRQNTDKRYELTTEFDYDRFGNIFEKKLYRDKANVIAEKFIYTRDGRFLEKYVNPIGFTTSYEYDPRYGILTQERDPNNLLVRYEHDDFGHIVKTLYPDNRSVTYAFKFLNEGKETGPLYEVRSNQSGAPELTQRFDMYGREVEATYSLLDSPYKETDQHTGTDGRVLTYDKLSVERKVNRLTSYDAQANLVMASKARYLRYISRRDTWSSTPRQCISTEDAVVIPEQTDEGSDGSPQVDLPDGSSILLSSVADSNFGTSLFFYDEFGRPTQSVLSGGRVIFTEYSANTKVETDNQKRKTTTTYNKRGEVSEVIDNQQNKISYAYDPWGNLTGITNPDGTVIKMTYDLLGRKAKLEDPAVGIIEYEYDEFDRLVKETNNGKRSIELSYDQVGRIRKKVTPEGEINWSYDKQIKGKVSEIIDVHRNRKLVAYDDLARPTSETHIINGKEFKIGYNYDELSRVTSKTFFPSGYRIEFDYVNNIAISVSEVKAGVKKVLARINSVGPEGQMTSKTYGNGISTTYRYNFNNDLLKSIETGKRVAPKSAPVITECGMGNTSEPLEGISGDADDRIQALQYDYDATGNLSKRSDLINGKVEEYFYDQLERLSRAVKSGQGDQKVTELKYDSAGNILSKSDKGQYEYDPASPQRVTYITKAGKLAHSFKYDDYGNLVEDQANNLKLVYSSFNKPIEISKGRQVQHASYGAENEEIISTFSSESVAGRVILKPFPDYEIITQDNVEITLHYVFLGNELAAIHHEVSGGSPRTEFNHFIHKDHRGSIHLVTDDQGNKVAEYDYGSFGVRTGVAPSTTVRGFTSHEHLDEFGLINASGRYYMPAIGRFTSADPIIQVASNLQSHNRYSYVLNNPQNLVDPSGFSWISRAGRNIKREFGRGVRNVGRTVGTAGQQTIDAHRNIYNEGDRFADKYGKQIVIVAAAAAITVASGGTMSGLAATMAYGALTNVAINAAVISYNGGSFQDILNSSVSSAVNGAASAAAFTAVGTGFELGGVNTSFGSAGYLGKVGAHAVVGGITSEINGGDFKNGMISASITQAFSPLIQHENLLSTNPDNAFYRVAFAGTIGGVAAYATGGDVLMGATTATFSRWFNDEYHLPKQPKPQNVCFQDPDSMPAIRNPPLFSRDLRHQNSAVQADGSGRNNDRGLGSAALSIMRGKAPSRLGALFQLIYSEDLH